MSLEREIAVLQDALHRADHAARNAKGPAERAKAIGLKAETAALLKMAEEQQTDAELSAWTSAATDRYGRPLEGSANPWRPKSA